MVDDIGSGALVDFARFGLQGDPVVVESIAAGADLVLFSGDKLLGGPQAGIIVGKKDYQKIEKDPLMRAFRLDKMTLAALEATLRLYRNLDRAIVEIPALRMLSLSPNESRRRAEKLAATLRCNPLFQSVEVRDDSAFVGGGTLPDLPLPTVLVAIALRDLSDAVFAERLRAGSPAVMARVQDGRVLFDLRTVFEEQDQDLADAITTAGRLLLPPDGSQDCQFLLQQYGNLEFAYRRKQIASKVLISLTGFPLKPPP